MDTKELLIALLYVGYQLQTKAGKAEAVGGYISGYRAFKQEFEKKEGSK